MNAMKKKFLVGIDSDGTVFDSMTVKHCDAFIPTMIKVWKLEAYAKEVKKICEEINLYSRTRGINRFPGLKMSFEHMKAQGIPVPDYEALTGFIEAGLGFSNKALKQYMEQKDAPFLKEVLLWSEEADRLFEEKMKTSEPFKHVREAIEKLLTFADIAVVSSASGTLLLKDFERVGLAELIGEIMGQENGTKAEQLALCKGNYYADNHVLMIGDAISDYDSVKQVNGLFYPIMPGKEAESWKEFLEHGMEKFLSEDYEGYQESVLKDFFAMLM